MLFWKELGARKKMTAGTRDKVEAVEIYLLYSTRAPLGQIFVSYVVLLRLSCIRSAHGVI